MYLAISPLSKKVFRKFDSFHARSCSRGKLYPVAIASTRQFHRHIVTCNAKLAIRNIKQHLVFPLGILVYEISRNKTHLVHTRMTFVLYLRRPDEHHIIN